MSARPERLADQFDVIEIFDGLPEPDYNVAPTVSVPAVFERSAKHADGSATRTLTTSPIILVSGDEAVLELCHEGRWSVAGGALPPVAVRFALQAGHVADVDRQRHHEDEDAERCE